jgi:5-methylcytosine-specific restriction endonuclease McrA
MQFSRSADPAEIRKERDKARLLRSSGWWKRKKEAGVCHFCGGRFAAGDLTMEHIVPLARGGKSTKSNIVPACKTCNSRKKYLLPVEWEEYLSKLSGSPDYDVPR